MSNNDGCAGCAVLLSTCAGMVAGAIGGYELAQGITETSSALANFAGLSIGAVAGGFTAWLSSSIGLGIVLGIKEGGSSLDYSGATSYFSRKRNLEETLSELNRELNASVKKPFKLETAFGAVKVRKNNYDISIESVTDFSKELVSIAEYDYAQLLGKEIGLHFPAYKGFKIFQTNNAAFFNGKVTQGSESELANLSYRTRLAEEKLSKSIGNRKAYWFTEEELRQATRKDLRLYV